PITEQGTLLDAGAASIRGFTGLTAWMREAERTWNEHKKNSLTLPEQYDYYGKLRSQFPIPPLRVLFAASGTHPAACLCRDSQTVVEHSLYWTRVGSEDEGHYLTAILGSEAARERIEHIQARGQFGARHFDKVMFTLPIPRFDPARPVHVQLAEVGAEAERFVGALDLDPGAPFQRVRSQVRAALREAGLVQRIDDAVNALLGAEG
ncbi:MAG: N-6 DNA methylase, partial [Vitreimonas sp.]